MPCDEGLDVGLNRVQHQRVHAVWLAHNCDNDECEQLDCQRLEVGERERRRGQED